MLPAGCAKKEIKTFSTDAERFEYEYESINGKFDDHFQKSRVLDIPKDNPIVYSSYSEIVNYMNSKNSFAVYFGFSKCPWCRGYIGAILESAKDCGIETVYYIDVYDSRDSYEIKDNKPQQTKKGAEGYDTLLEKMENVLSDYVLNDNNGNEINTGEKRIYAPNLIIVKDGVAIELAPDCELFTDPYEEITEEIYQDMKQIYMNAFSQLL